MFDTDKLRKEINKVVNKYFDQGVAELVEMRMAESEKKKKKLPNRCRPLRGWKTQQQTVHFATTQTMTHCIFLTAPTYQLH